MKPERTDKPITAKIETMKKSDFGKTPQATLHQAVTKTHSPVLKADAATKRGEKPPMVVARGDDDLMSAPQEKT